MVICPICQAPLSTDGPSWRCENGHSFDVARQGYVNLLPVQQKHSLHPGDSRPMVAARRNFLSAGYYVPIAKTMRELVRTYDPEARCILDAGCGEGYYLSFLDDVPERWGIDISKEAVRMAAARDKQTRWLTATAAHLPFSDQSFDCVLSMFALTAEEEFARVLKPGGIFLQVLAGPDHLLGLKNIIYPEILHKEKEQHRELPGFDLTDSRTIEFDFELDTAEMVHSLLCMTPHVNRISKEGAEALDATEHLKDRAQVVFNVYSRA